MNLLQGLNNYYGSIKEKYQNELRRQRRIYARRVKALNYTKNGLRGRAKNTTTRLKAAAHDRDHYPSKYNT